MKKLYKGLVTLAVVLGLTACGNPTDTSASDTKVELDATIRADGNVGGYAIVGPNTWFVGDTQIANWGEFKGGAACMTATSYKAVGEKNYELGKHLQDNHASVVYMISDARCATRFTTGSKTTWGTEKTEIDQAYWIKFAAYDHDEDTKQDVITTWIPDTDDKAHGHSMTPDTLWIADNYAKEADEYGYDWTTNPHIIAGAGSYTLVVAKYETPLEGGVVWGLGAIKDQDMPEAGPKEFSHWKITGTVQGDTEETQWKVDVDTEGYAFSKDGKLTATFKEGDEFKITKYFTDMTGSWDGEIGAKGIVSEDGAFGGEGNIVCKIAGTYDLVMNAEQTQVTFTAHAA